MKCLVIITFHVIDTIVVIISYTFYTMSVRKGFISGPTYVNALELTTYLTKKCSTVVWHESEKLKQTVKVKYLSEATYHEFI